MSSPVGALLNERYRIEEPIGRGGMSTVYKAFDTTLERPVAIKMMHRDVARDADQLERFRREARAIAKLSSPYVVGVIDAGEEDHTPYIVLEYVEGETLKERIRRLHRLPVPEAVAYAIEIARGLQAAHDRGIVHRDVKPQNVLLDEDGAARVTDFGIARSLTEEGLTADGRVLGTTDYVSPEQALGHAVTPQSDIYSLGVVLFEMLTGDVPFHGENQVAVAMHHVRDEMPDVRAARPEVSSALGAIVDRATAKSLDERYPDCGELIADLEDALTIETSRSGHLTGEATAVFQSLPEGKRRRVSGRIQHPWRWLAGIAAVAVLVVVLFALLAHRAERGTGTPHARPTAGLRAISLGQGAAKDYDPFGGDGEHPLQAGAALDGDPVTFWPTERYLDGNLAKPGVGLVIDARPRVVARRMDILTATPGWSGAVYAAPAGSLPKSFDDPAWQRVGTIRQATHQTRVPLDTRGRALRWYLVWIEHFAPGQEQVKLNEVSLYR
ncbi:MAG TPA: protein kinase [Solirubrobacteraceae bacterium]|nr:protein kinase [Solirubrobacteraceae bacterium]